MASWAEASREAMFKRVEGGFLFGAGGFAHQYLVTEAQKAEIQRLSCSAFGENKSSLTRRLSGAPCHGSNRRLQR